MTWGFTTHDPFEALLDRLESAELDATINLASNLATALRILSSHPTVQALVRTCEDNPWLAGVAYARLSALCHRPISRDYTSPYDSAIVALLFVLDRCDPFAAASAAAIAIKAVNAHWAARFASMLLDDLSPSTPPAARNARSRLPAPPVVSPRGHPTVPRLGPQASFSA